jgi:hypothetical protein
MAEQERLEKLRLAEERDSEASRGARAGKTMGGLLTTSERGVTSGKKTKLSGIV